MINTIKLAGAPGIDELARHRALGTFSTLQPYEQAQILGDCLVRRVANIMHEVQTFRACDRAEAGAAMVRLIQKLAAGATNPAQPLRLVVKDDGAD